MTDITLQHIKDTINKQKLDKLSESDALILKNKIVDAELRARLKKEQEYAETSLRNVTTAWRNLTRLATTDELKATIAETAKQFEQDYDKYIERIKALQEDLRAAEEYYTLMIQAHSRALDKLVSTQQSRIRALHDDFLKQFHELKSSFEEERDEVTVRHIGTRTELLHVIAVVKESEEQKAFAAEARHTQTREQIRRRGVERIHALQTELDASIEMLERAFAEAHAKYLSATDQRVQDFKALAARGQYETHVKEKQKRMIARLQKRLEFAQAQLYYVEREEKEKIDLLTIEKGRLNEQMKELKARLTSAQNTHMSSMRETAVKANELKQKMNDMCDLASAVLRAAEEARALEPLALRVHASKSSILPQSSTLPNACHDGAASTAVGPQIVGGRNAPTNTQDIYLDQEPHNPDVDVTAGDVASTEPLLPSLAEVMSDAEVMHRFYERYNAALMERCALERRHNALNEENQNLKRALQECLDATSVPLDKPVNGLLILNGKGAPRGAYASSPPTSHVEIAVHAANIARHVRA